MKDDLISRQAAIRWVKTECNPYGKPTLDFESGKKVIEHLKQMPSAQPETHEERTETHACDLISRQAALDAVNDCGICIQKILDLPSAEPWDIVKTMLKELEQKEERLYFDYRDTKARLNAISKIAESSQKPNQKIAGIKPLAKTEVTE